MQGETNADTNTVLSNLAADTKHNLYLFARQSTRSANYQKSLTIRKWIAVPDGNDRTRTEFAGNTSLILDVTPTSLRPATPPTTLKITGPNLQYSGSPKPLTLVVQGGIGDYWQAQLNRGGARQSHVYDESDNQFTPPASWFPTSANSTSIYNLGIWAGNYGTGILALRNSHADKVVDPAFVLSLKKTQSTLNGVYVNLNSHGAGSDIVFLNDWGTGTATLRQSSRTIRFTVKITPASNNSDNWDTVQYLLYTRTGTTPTQSSQIFSWRETSNTKEFVISVAQAGTYTYHVDVIVKGTNERVATTSRTKRITLTLIFN